MEPACHDLHLCWSADSSPEISVICLFCLISGNVQKYFKIGLRKPPAEKEKKLFFSLKDQLKAELRKWSWLIFRKQTQGLTDLCTVLLHTYVIPLSFLPSPLEQWNVHLYFDFGCLPVLFLKRKYCHGKNLRDSIWKWMETLLYFASVKL